MTGAARSRRRSGAGLAPLAVAVLLAAGAPACTGGDDPEGTPAPPPSDACGMLTRWRAEAFLGGPVLEPRATGSAVAGDGLVLTCAYVLAADPTRTVAVLLRRVDGQGDDLGAAIEALRTGTYAGVPTREVRGVGERALWAEPAGLHQLTVLADDDVLVVSVAPTVSVDATTDLARELLAARPDPGV